MATFSGETVVNTVNINVSGNTSTTLYTVPAGRYARLYIRDVDSTAVGTPSYTISGITLLTGFRYSPFAQDSGTDIKLSLEILMESGDTISRIASANSAGFSAYILEYNKP